MRQDKLEVIKGALGRRITQIGQYISGNTTDDKTRSKLAFNTEISEQVEP